jgi:hypothetical protein
MPGLLVEACWPPVTILWISTVLVVGTTGISLHHGLDSFLMKVFQHEPCYNDTLYLLPHYTIWHRMSFCTPTTCTSHYKGNQNLLVKSRSAALAKSQILQLNSRGFPVHAKLSHKHEEYSPWTMEGEHTGEKFLRERTKLPHEAGRDPEWWSDWV